MSKKINPLHEKLAALYRLSPKNSKLSHLVTEAKTALGITSPKRLTDNEQRAVYQWHVNIISQPIDNEAVNIISQPDNNDSVNIDSQSDNVELYSQPTSDGIVELFSQAGCNKAVEIISQPIDNEAVNIISQDTSNNDVNIVSQADNGNVEIFSQQRIAFYTTDNGTRKRQVIALDGFYVNALILVAGIDKKGVPAWIQSAIDGFTGFDCNEGITKQVKYLIVSALIARVNRDDIICR